MREGVADEILHHSFAIPRQRERVLDPPEEACVTHPAAHIGLWLVFLVTAMLLPFLPGRYDPIAD